MANPVRRLVHTTGHIGISRALEAIPRDLRTHILAHAVERASAPAVAAIKKAARRSVRTGALYMAIGNKVKKYEANATAVSVIGVRRGYYRGRELVKKITSLADKKGTESPSHYAHLIEFGHHIAKGGALRPQYNLVKTGIGKFAKDGREITRMKRGTIMQNAKGSSAGWVQPRPFMRPGMLASRNQVANELLTGVSEGIEKVRAKLVKQGAHAA